MVSVVALCAYSLHKCILSVSCFPHYLRVAGKQDITKTINLRKELKLLHHCPAHFCQPTTSNLVSARLTSVNQNKNPDISVWSQTIVIIRKISSEIVDYISLEVLLSFPSKQSVRDVLTTCTNSVLDPLLTESRVRNAWKINEKRYLILSHQNPIFLQIVTTPGVPKICEEYLRSTKLSKFPVNAQRWWLLRSEMKCEKVWW